jgi:hypothetical protein
LSSLSLSGIRECVVQIGTRLLTSRRRLGSPYVAQARIFEEVQEHAIDIIIHGAKYLDTF